MSLKCFCIGFKHQRCGPYQPRPAALVLRTKKKKPYVIPPTARLQDQKVLGPSGGGMVIVYFLLAYEYLERYPRLVWVGPLALKPEHIPYHHPGIRDELIEMRIKKATMSTMVALIVLKTRSALWRALGRNARSSLSSRNNL